MSIDRLLRILVTLKLFEITLAMEARRRRRATGETCAQAMRCRHECLFPSRWRRACRAYESAGAGGVAAPACGVTRAMWAMHRFPSTIGSPTVTSKAEECPAS